MTPSGHQVVDTGVRLRIWIRDWLGVGVFFFFFSFVFVSHFYWLFIALKTLPLCDTQYTWPRLVGSPGYFV